MNNQLRDEALIQHLMELRKRDMDGFMQLVMTTLKEYRQLAIDDLAEKSKKVTALILLLNHMESKEQYEDCAFLVELKKQIEDAKGS